MKRMLLIVICCLIALSGCTKKNTGNCDLAKVFDDIKITEAKEGYVKIKNEVGTVEVIEETEDRCKSRGEYEGTFSSLFYYTNVIENTLILYYDGYSCKLSEYKGKKSDSNTTLEDKLNMLRDCKDTYAYLLEANTFVLSSTLISKDTNAWTFNDVSFKVKNLVVTKREGESKTFTGLSAVGNKGVAYSEIDEYRVYSIEEYDFKLPKWEELSEYIEFTRDYKNEFRELLEKWRSELSRV